MTIRISPDFSSFVATDDPQRPLLVRLDGSPVTPEWALYPAFAADPGFRLVPDSAIRFLLP